MPRRRSVLSRLLLALAALLTVAALLAAWVRGQLLDPQRYVETSVEVLAQPQVQQATAAYLAEQLVAVPGLEAQLAQRLPGVTKGLARPAADRVERATEAAALRALSSAPLQRVWREANAASYRQLRRAVEDDRRGALVLDLRPLLGQLATSVGLDGRTVANLPERRGVVRILTAEEVDQVRGAANALRAAAWGLAIAALLALLAAIAAAQNRAAGVRDAGAALLLAAVVVLVARRLVGGALIDEVVTDGSVATAGKEAWWIVTSHLLELARAVAGVGALLLVGGALVRRRGGAAPR